VNPALLNQLEIAVRARNAALADSLLPGLPEPEIKSILRGAGVPGDTTVLVLLYSWHNGISETAPLSPPDRELFPGTACWFLPLQLAVEHFAAFRTAAAGLVEITHDPTRISASADRYFPLFWDGATGYLAVDLNETLHGIVVAEFESEEPYRLAYKTFEEFIADAIHVNKTNDTLACFRPK
jgi:hypothetical protein